MDIRSIYNYRRKKCGFHFRVIPVFAHYPRFPRLPAYPDPHLFSSLQQVADILKLRKVDIGADIGANIKRKSGLSRIPALHLASIGKMVMGYCGDSGTMQGGQLCFFLLVGAVFATISGRVELEIIGDFRLIILLQIRSIRFH